MAHDETITTAPVRVDIRSVEKRLAGLWSGAAEGAVPGVTGPLTRTLLLNLLVYAASDKEADEAARVVAELAAEHPARAIIADAAPGQPGRELEADISMFCTLGERGRRLCGESIRFRTHGVSSAALGTIMPVLAPDLPVYLWTPGELAEDGGALDSFVGIADHWIIDSRGFSKRDDMYQLALQLGPDSNPSVILHDLSWATLAQWREIVASLFDPLPARQYLPGITEVTIVYQPQDERPRVEAVMMAAWLATRLGWQVQTVAAEKLGLRMKAKTDGRDVSVLLSPKEDALLAVDEVRIECRIDGRRGLLRASRADYPEEVWLEMEGPDLPRGRRTVRSERQSTVREMCQVLDMPGRDRLYEKALPCIQTLVRETDRDR